MKYLTLLRPSHWIKNLFLFIPVFFAGELFDLSKIWHLFFGALIFSLSASSIYIINDLMDAESDSIHPEKCKRPIASGAIKKPTALCLFAICFFICEITGYHLNKQFWGLINIYVLINIAYSLGLKNVSVLDILILSIGFVIRVIAGGIIIAINISEWLIVMIFLLALFIAIAKRRDDIVIKTRTGLDMRKASKDYNLEYLNIILALVSATMIISYLMYTLSPETELRLHSYKLYYTFIFVISGLLRYLQITYVENNSGSPVRILLNDRFIQISIMLWILSFFFIIYCRNLSV